jgi:phosphate-selective porin OprO and OprP
LLKTTKTTLGIVAIYMRFLFAPVMVNAQESQTNESPESEEVTWKAYWSEGFKFKSSDDRFNFKFGGRIMNDWVVPVSYDNNLRTSFGEPTHGTEFRRVRFYNSGTIYNNIEYKLHFDFTGGDADLKDAFIRINQIPAIGHLKIGHYKEPFGLEELTSSKYITFMARAMTSHFQPSRNAGVTIHNEILDGRMTYALGTFRDTDVYGSSIAGETARYNATGRITGLPWKHGDNFLHLGLAYQMRNPDEKEVQYSSSRKPTSNLILSIPEQ